MIQMATRSDRLRGATHQQLIAELDRSLAALSFANRDLGRGLVRARNAVSNGRDPLDDETVGHYQQLAAITGDIGDLLAELGTKR